MAALIGNLRTDSRQWALGAAYIAAFLLLEIATMEYGSLSGSWRPAQALTLALLMVGGPRHVPTVFAAMMMSQLITNDATLTVQSAESATVAIGYGLAARVLRHEVDFDPGLARLRDVLMFIVVAVSAAMAVAAMSVAIRAGAGQVPWPSHSQVTLRLWASEAVTFLSLTPALLHHHRVLFDPRRWSALLRADSILAAATIVLIIWFLFRQPHADSFKTFYLVFLPLIWVSVRHGLAGASLALALTQTCLYLVTLHTTETSLAIADLEMLMLGLAVTTLVLGAVVNEQRRADAWLRAHQAELAHASRLSATGEMASALAHELNQPLAATISYVRACQMAMSRQGAESALAEMMDKAVLQAERASQVVRGLRAFLRKEDAPRVPGQIRVLVSEALALAGAEAGQQGVTLRNQVPDRLPPVCVDVIQIEQVILNLVRNGVDSVASNPHCKRGQVTVSAQRRHDMIEVTVSDTGPGLPAEVADRLFTPFTTTKPTGMGLGLVIARSIVEAHGGRLWADSYTRPGATFRFTLPIDNGDANAG